MSSTVRLYDPPKVGGDALSYCTKCRMELAHVIVSMVDGKPSKVECKTCKGTHRFKTGGGASPAPRRPRFRGSVPKVTIRVAELWQQKVAERSQANIAPYLTTHTFKTGELLQHPNFGVGVVEGIRSSTKMAVLFREGEKILVHGLVAPSLP